MAGGIENTKNAHVIDQLGLAWFVFGLKTFSTRLTLSNDAIFHLKLANSVNRLEIRDDWKLLHSFRLKASDHIFVKASDLTINYVTFHLKLANSANRLESKVIREYF